MKNKVKEIEEEITQKMQEFNDLGKRQQEVGQEIIKLQGKLEAYKEIQNGNKRNTN